MKEKLVKTYSILLGKFGPQHWWPMQNGFEPKEWEIVVGAVLTQNTGWKSVEKALENLKSSGITTPEKTIGIGTKELENIIRPSGFYKQKAERLKTISRFILEKNYDFTREELLGVKGIGPETADSILLYAFNKPHFVVDAYTKRILSRLKIIGADENYENIRKFFEGNLPRDTNLYKEFHALIVELGKNFCRKEPACTKCPIRKMCRK